LPHLQRRPSRNLMKTMRLFSAMGWGYPNVGAQPNTSNRLKIRILLKWWGGMCRCHRRQPKKDASRATVHCTLSTGHNRLNIRMLTKWQGEGGPHGGSRYKGVNRAHAWHFQTTRPERASRELLPHRSAEPLFHAVATKRGTTMGSS
jgi:hypothetical protein